MLYRRALAVFCFSVMASGLAGRAWGQPGMGIEPIADQTIPSGKTLVVPLPATDPAGPARTYTVSVGAATMVSGSATVSATNAGILARVRTGDPHFYMTVTYTDSNGVRQYDQPMEFQLFREYTPLTEQLIAGLTSGGFYSPKTTGTSTQYITFHRVISSAIQGGDPNGDGTGGPGFTFPNEYSSSLIFSGTGGQLAMANASGNLGGNGAYIRLPVDSNGSQFFVTIGQPRSYDYTYTLFGQLLRGFETLNGIAGTPVGPNSSGEDSAPVTPVDITSAEVIPNNTDGVLILSGTGVADATVTVTASAAGQAPVTTSFTAHLVADTVSDPPFFNRPMDFAAAKTPVKVTLEGTDLQKDLLVYGYARITPVYDSQTLYDGTTPYVFPLVTTGTSPTLSLPLRTGTTNEVLATVDVSNAPTKPQGYRGADKHTFFVTVGEPALTGSLTGLITGSNGDLVLPATYPLARLTSADNKLTAADLTATVNWGDGTVVSGTNEVNTVPDTSSRTVRRFIIQAGHEYKLPGEYPILVTVDEHKQERFILSGTANISGSGLSIAPHELYSAGGKVDNEVVASFTDATGALVPSEYATSINWGDGVVSSGTVSVSKGQYRILGSHTYTDPEDFTVGTSIVRTGDGWGGADGHWGGCAAYGWATAHVSAVIRAERHLPPFPQAHLAQMWNVYAQISGSGSSFQQALSGQVQITNSGNVPSLSGSLSAVVVTGAGQFALTSGTSTVTEFPVKALNPGQSQIITFERKGSVSDTRLHVPTGYQPQSGDTYYGVLTYSDPVADFDGAEKFIEIGQQQ